MDDQFIENTFSTYEDKDELIRRFLGIFRRVVKSGLVRHPEVLINRNDFMKDGTQWKQIEYNLSSVLYPHKA